MSSTTYMIGDWVLSKKFNKPVQLTLSDFAVAHLHEGIFDSSEWFEINVEPIPPTEDWLRDFGFTYDEETSYWSILVPYGTRGYMFDVEFIDGVIHVTLGNTGWHYASIHLFQRFFLGLIGVHLTKKTK